MACPVCGGVTTCPGGKYLKVRPPLPEEILYLPRDENPGEGWVNTHTRKREKIWVRKTGIDGARLRLTGTAQAGRMYRHYGVQGVWVGMCTYAFYVLPAPAQTP